MKQYLLLLSVMLFMGACSHDCTDTAAPAQTVSVEMNVRTAHMATRTADEMSIRDVNLYLYDAQGAPVLHRYLTDSALRFCCAPGTYRMRIAANMGDDLGAAADMEAAMLSYADSYEFLPMTWEGEITIPNNAAGVAYLPDIEMRRAVAKVSCRIRVEDPRIELRALRLCSIPRMARLFGPHDAPSVVAEDYTVSAETPLSGLEATGEYYLLPNMQGVVGSIADQRQRNAAHAPQRSSYLMIRAVKGDRVLAYSVYLGENSTSDFNVRANALYRLDIAILSDDTLDTRITAYTLMAWDDFQNGSYGSYCIHDPGYNVYAGVDGNDGLHAIRGRLELTEGDAEYFRFGDRAGAVHDFDLYDPHGENRFQIEYRPPYYTAENALLAYRITFSDDYGTAQEYEFSHLMANVVYVHVPASGSVTVDRSLWSSKRTSKDGELITALWVEDGCRFTARAQSGYVFTGWYADKECTEKLYGGSSFTYVPQAVAGHLYVRIQDKDKPLDASGTANCYIAPALDTRYSFDATVRGNGVSTTGITAAPLAGSTARVIWETGTIRGAIVRAAEYDKGRICIETGAAHGNALVGLFNAAGACIWSWHIWAADYDPAAGTQTYGTGAVFMDRNLGAESATKIAVEENGMYYQWGRKDPFPYPAAHGSGAMTPVVALEGYEFSVHNTDDPFSLDDFSIAGATAHPTTFLHHAGSHRWCYVFEPYLWNAENTLRSGKTLYDPCPPGWRVPPARAWNAAAMKRTYTVSGCGCAVRESASSQTIYYPYTGMLSDNSGRMQYALTDAEVCLWAADTKTSAAQTADRFRILDGTISVSDNDAFLATGHPVRCIKE